MKKDKKKSGIGKWIVTSGISLVLVIAMIVAFVMTTAYEGVINLALKTETTKVEADPNDKTDTEYFKSAYASVDEVRDAGMEIAICGLLRKTGFVCCRRYGKYCQSARYFEQKRCGFPYFRLAFER